MSAPLPDAGLPKAGLPLETRLQTAWPETQWHDLTVVVAVSGGPDSVALLRALVRLRPPASAGRLIAAHLNHQLRGAESTADQQFVAALAADLGVTLIVGQAEGLAGEQDGIEAAAREARYAFLLRAAEQAGARYVVTGHTADDQAETILHHMLRGTGLRGLGGMRRARRMSDLVTLARPLLEINRAEVLAYLQALGQPFRTDATNADRELTRNRIRHELLPLLARDFNPAIVESLLRLGRVAGDAQTVLDAAAAQLSVASQFGWGARIRADRLRRLTGTDRHLLRELFAVLWRREGWPLQAMGFDEWDRLAGLALDPPLEKSRKTTLPGAIRAERTAGQLLLFAARDESSLRDTKSR